MTTFTVIPGTDLSGLAGGLVLHDRRDSGALPFTVDEEALALAAEAVGLAPHQLAGIHIVLRDQRQPGQQGSCRRRPDGTFTVVVRPARKDAWTDRRLYPINNSLLHELRHVVQHLDAEMVGDNFDVTYSKATAAVGFEANPFEVEARGFGRLARLGDEEIVIRYAETGTEVVVPAAGRYVWALQAEQVAPIVTQAEVLAALEAVTDPAAKAVLRWVVDVVVDAWTEITAIREENSHV